MRGILEYYIDTDHGFTRSRNNYEQRYNLGTLYRQRLEYRFRIGC